MTRKLQASNQITQLPHKKPKIITRICIMYSENIEQHNKRSIQKLHWIQNNLDMIYDISHRVTIVPQKITKRNKWKHKQNCITSIVMIRKQVHL